MGGTCLQMTRLIRAANSISIIRRRPMAECLSVDDVDPRPMALTAFITCPPTARRPAFVSGWTQSHEGCRSSVRETFGNGERVKASQPVFGSACQDHSVSRSGAFSSRPARALGGATYVEACAGGASVHR